LLLALDIHPRVVMEIVGEGHVHPTDLVAGVSPLA
jgi:hypothetical protein